MQKDRLFQIIYILMEKDGISAKELADRMQVSVRTVYRDIESLSVAGIPLYTCRGKGGGIHLMPGFVLEKSLFSKEEQDEILFALQGMQATGAGEQGQALQRLREFFGRREPDWIEVDFSRWESAEEEKQFFETVKQGIWQQRKITFLYHGTNGSKTKRVVEPMKLCLKQGSWYLQGFCCQRQAYRSFKICRMEQVALTAEPFLPKAPPPAITTGPVLKQQNNTRLRLLFSPAVTYRVYDEFGRSRVLVREDGFLEVEITYPLDSWVYGYLFSFGEEVTVLEPADVAVQLGKMAENIAEKYKSTL